MKNKYLATVAATLIIFGLTACGKKSDTTEENSAPSTSVSSTSASESKVTTVVTTSNNEEYPIAPEDKGFYDEEFADFVKKQGLDKSLSPLMTRAKKLYGGIDGLNAFEYPEEFNKGTDGEYWGSVMTSDNKEKKMSITQTIDLLSEVFNRDFAETKFYDSYYLSDDKKNYQAGVRGSNLTYHGHYFTLVSKSDDTIVFKCTCLSDGDPDADYSIKYDEERSEWIIVDHYSWNQETRSYDIDDSEIGKVYKPRDITKLREYNFTLKKIDGTWKFMQFDLWR